MCFKMFFHEIHTLALKKPFNRGAAALVLAVAAGFPVGREGPMLCLGATKKKIALG